MIVFVCCVIVPDPRMLQHARVGFFIRVCLDHILNHPDAGERDSLHYF